MQELLFKIKYYVIYVVFNFAGIKKWQFDLRLYVAAF